MLPDPWRIVLPALIFFLCMALLSTFYTVHSVRRLSAVCNQLILSDDNGTVSMATCASTIDQVLLAPLSNPDYAALSPSALYYSLTVCIYAVTFMWLLAVCLLTVRCIFGSDFKAVTVQVTPHKDSIVRSA